MGLLVFGAGCGDDTGALDGGRGDSGGSADTAVASDGSGTDVLVDGSPVDAAGADSRPPDAPMDSGVDARPDGFAIAPLPTESVPAGMVPVTIGLTHGRIVTSCDGMETIALDEVFSPDAHDHHEHALKGAAFGNGVFVFSTGHGAPGHVFRSTDGLTWTQLPGERFHYADGSTGALDAGTAGVIYDGSRFVLLRGRQPRMASEDGLDWTEFGEELDYRYFHHRGHRYFPSLGRLYVEGENVDKSERWLLLSVDGGRTFTEQLETGFSSNCRVPQVYAHNTMLTGGQELQSCASFDGGESWSVIDVPDDLGTLVPTAAGFVAFRGWRREFRRFDGAAWSEETIDSSVRFAAAARAPWGAYVVASREDPEFWVSEDTTTFRAVTSTAGERPIRRFLFGYAMPSARCPLP